jgi:hypothetical protein
MKIKIQTQVDKYTIGDAEIKEYAPRERMTRALKKLGMFWGAAVVSVLIPVFHFVLVPGFLILGPIMARLQYKQELEIKDAKFPCPDCKKEVEFKKVSGNWPLRQICPHCSSQLYLNKEVAG